MIITFTTEDGTRTGEIVDGPRLPEFEADGLYVIVREHGEFLGATSIGSDASLYEIEACIRQMRSNDPEHLSNGRSVDAGLVEKGAWVWMHGVWIQIDYWKHETDGAVQLNHTWFSAGERVLVHMSPQTIAREKSLVKRAIQAKIRGNMDEFPARIQRKVKALSEYKAPKGTGGYSRLPKHSKPRG